MAARKLKPPKHRTLSDAATQKFVWTQLSRADDRTVAIVGAGFVEHHLARAILAKLRPLTSAEHNQLFAGRGVLSSFFAKIQIGYALNIYAKVGKAELEAVNDVRNAFAHEIKVGSFAHPRVRKQCQSLQAQNYKLWLAHRTKSKPPAFPRSLRHKFMESVIGLYITLSASRKQMERPAATLAQSFDNPQFLAWLDTRAQPRKPVSRSRGRKSQPPQLQPRSSRA